MTSTGGGGLKRFAGAAGSGLEKQGGFFAFTQAPARNVPSTRRGEDGRGAWPGEAVPSMPPPGPPPAGEGKTRRIAPTFIQASWKGENVERFQNSTGGGGSIKTMILGSSPGMTEWVRLELNGGRWGIDRCFSTIPAARRHPARHGTKSAHETRRLTAPGHKYP